MLPLNILRSTARLRDRFPCSRVGSREVKIESAKTEARYRYLRAESLRTNITLPVARRTVRNVKHNHNPRVDVVAACEGTLPLREHSPHRSRIQYAKSTSWWRHQQCPKWSRGQSLSTPCARARPLSPEGPCLPSSSFRSTQRRLHSYILLRPTR